jgi:hypothetical protein
MSARQRLMALRDAPWDAPSLVAGELLHGHGWHVPRFVPKTKPGKAGGNKRLFKCLRVSGRSLRDVRT